MAKTIRIAHDGYDAETETDPSRFSLIADGDNVLIKEAARGAGTNTGTINHGLGYIPFFLMYGEGATAGRYQLIGQYTYLDEWKIYANSSDIVIVTGSGNRKHFIFHDNMEET